MAKGNTFIVSQVIVSIGKSATIRLNVDDKSVGIPVSAELKAYFNEQFKGNTPNQQKRLATVFNVIRAAYKKGVADGKKANA